MPYKTIREITETTGVTERALRYYDEKGVLHPTDKSLSGRREWLYDEEAVWKIRLIAFLRMSGLSIEDIRRVLEDEPDEVVNLLKVHLEKLKEECRILDEKIVATELMLLIEEQQYGEEIKEDLRRTVTKHYEDKRRGRE